MEVIVVDDGSTDDTAARAGKYPVRILRKSNGGPASARNLGVREAHGDVILFIDSDCVPQPTWLKSMTEPFGNGEISGVKGIYTTRQKSLVARFVQLEFEERYMMLAGNSCIDFVDSYSAAFRKDDFLSVGGFDESFPKADNEDVDLSYKLARSGCKMVFRPEGVVEHLQHPDSLLKYIRVKFSRGFWRTAVYKRHPAKAVKDSYTPQTLKLQILAAAALWVGMLIGAVWNQWLPAAVIAVCFLLLTVKFMVKVFRYDPAATIIAPLMHLLRANCFLVGVTAGFFRHFLFRRRLRRK